jgi:hypothetical protein
VIPPWWARPTAAVLVNGFGGVRPTRVHGTPRRAAPAAAGTILTHALATHVRDAVQLTGQALPADPGRSAEEIARGEHL